MWNNMENFNAPHSTFEAILFEGSSTIAFRYGDLNNNGAGAVVGRQQRRDG